MSLTRSEIKCAMQTALLGEVYPSIRAIACAYNPITKNFLIRYYLDRKPTDDDYDSVSEVMTEFISHFKYSEFDELKEECQYSELPASKIDPLDGFVYARKE
jgi:hypothetical protein